MFSADKICELVGICGKDDNGSSLMCFCGRYSAEEEKWMSFSADRMNLIYTPTQPEYGEERMVE